MPAGSPTASPRKRRRREVKAGGRSQAGTEAGQEEDEPGRSGRGQADHAPKGSGPDAARPTPAVRDGPASRRLPAPPRVPRCAGRHRLTRTASGPEGHQQGARTGPPGQVNVVKIGCTLPLATFTPFELMPQGLTARVNVVYVPPGLLVRDAERGLELPVVSSALLDTRGRTTYTTFTLATSCCGTGI